MLYEIKNVPNNNADISRFEHTNRGMRTNINVVSIHCLVIQ